MAGTDGPPDLAEVKLREEVRAEFEQDQAKRDELAQTHDRRVRALLVSFSFLAALLVPFAALVLGVAVRLFRLAAGF